MALNDLTVRHAKATDKDITLTDFDGLTLFVPVQGRKSWHFRYYWGGKRSRFSLGTYPELSLREARALRDEARTLLAKGLNPRNERRRQRQAVALAGRNTFPVVYQKWRDHRKLSLEEGRQSTMDQIQRIFDKDVIPILRHLTMSEVTQAHLLDIIARVEERGALSTAEKLRTWFKQLFAYAKITVPGVKENPALDLKVVAVPLPPPVHNPFLRMPELPEMLQRLRRDRGRLTTQLGIRLLLLTGVRTGELRHATPDQFDLDQGLWRIPVQRLKQRRALAKRKQRARTENIPPYIVPLSVQAMEIVRYLMEQKKPVQVYLLPGQNDLTKTISENTLNHALIRMGYKDQLTGHGIRATISTALNEIGYLKKWVDAQLSHSDPDKISSSYNHAEYVEQRRVMMQDWADRLDLFEQNHVQAASMHLTITLQGIPTITGQARIEPPAVDLQAPIMVVAPPSDDMPTLPASVQRLPAVELPDYAKPRISNIQQERLLLLDIFERPENLSALDYARLVGKSRRWVNHVIQMRKLLALNLGHRGVRVPDWQFDPLKSRLVQRVLAITDPTMDAWQIYHVLTQPDESFEKQAPIHAVTHQNVEKIAAQVQSILANMTWPVTPYTTLSEMQ